MQWWGKDSNLRRALTRQIYSLLPLATRPPHRTFARRTHVTAVTAHRCHSYSDPGDESPRSRDRADGQNRTGNRLITNQVLCQLSYVSRRPILRENRRIVGPRNGVKTRWDRSLGGYWVLGDGCWASDQRPPTTEPYLARFHFVPAAVSSIVMPRSVNSARMRSASIKSRRSRAARRAARRSSTQATSSGSST
jgi:hypothetical protein